MNEKQILKQLDELKSLINVEVKPKPKRKQKQKNESSQEVKQYGNGKYVIYYRDNKTLELNTDALKHMIQMLGEHNEDDIMGFTSVTYDDKTQHMGLEYLHADDGEWYLDIFIQTTRSTGEFVFKTVISQKTISQLFGSDVMDSTTVLY